MGEGVVRVSKCDTVAIMRIYPAEFEIVRSEVYLASLRIKNMLWGILPPSMATEKRTISNTTVGTAKWNCYCFSCHEY